MTFRSVKQQKIYLSIEVYENIHTHKWDELTFDFVVSSNHGKLSCTDEYDIRFEKMRFDDYLILTC